MRKRKPVITSQYGTTTEWARRQCAANMTEFPELKQRIEQSLISMHGAVKGLAMARERYPEAYEEKK